MASPPPPPAHDGAERTESPVVPLALLTEVLRSVAAALHDGPVQGLVAGRLLVETGVGPGPHDEAVVGRGLQAVSRAAEEVRDLMWALEGVVLRPGHLATDIADAVARAARPDGAVAVAVVLADGHDDDREDVAAVGTLAQALHEVLVEVLLAGGHAVALSVVADAEALHARLGTAPSAAWADGPWVRLARARLASLGGGLTTAVEGATRTTRLSLPVLP